MIRNYIITTLRNLVRNGTYSLINILGLSIGITSCIVIFLLIRYDLGFDRFHNKFESIYRVVQNSQSASGEEFGSSTPYPFVNAFRNDFPQIPLSTQFHYEEEVFLTVDDRKLVTENVIFADSLFFQVFDFEIVSGNPTSDLAQPGKAFVSESFAAKMGYSSDAVPLTVRISNRIDVEIVGILKDVPAASHIQFQMVVSMPSLTSDFVGGFPLDQWSLTAAGFTYVVLPPEVKPAEVEQSLKAFVAKYYQPESSKRKSFHLQPLSEIHFDQRYTENPAPGSNASYKELKVMGLLGIFILAIGCINFINLATALAVRKSREIGVRKTLGARRTQLAAYFLTETFFITAVAILISLGLAEWLTPWVNSFIGKEISLRLFSDGPLAMFLITLAIFTTLLSGFYPALILSGFNPIAVLKNKMVTPSGSGIAVRKVLVVCQFMIAQMLIIGTLIVSDQMKFFRTKPLGFEKEAVILVNVPENQKEKLESLKERMLSNPAITSVSFSLGAPTSDNNFSTNYFLTERGGNELFPIGVKPVDRDYLETYGIELKAGRWFTEGEEKAADTSLPEEEQRFVYLLNESGARQLGFDRPEDIIGKNITTGLNRINAEVIGVVRDFHVTSLHSEIKPVVLVNFPYFYYEAGIKVRGGELQQTIAFIEQQWGDSFPDYFFEYNFLDQKLERLYRQDDRTFTLIRIFAGISIFIGCLGLYGLVSFMANQKLKEVGIRKVMGASVESIVLLFSRDFIRLIIISFLIAAPLAWYAMSQWLETFAYHISIHWSVFLISVAATLIIALATVSYRSVRAAITNPADTLRTD
jgi:putative ABC transport system permease protein